MTVAEFRGMTNRPPVLPCSQIVFVDTDGKRLSVKSIQTQTPRDHEDKPSGIPVAIVILEQDSKE